MRMWVRSLASLSGLRIRCCHELWCKLQTRLGSGLAVAVAVAGSCNSDLIPSLGSPMCCRCGPTKKKNLYPITLLNLSMSSSSFLVASLGCSMYSVIEQWQFYLFSNLDSFYDFSLLIAVAKTSKTMLNHSGETGHPCLVPDLSRNAFNFSPLRMILAVSLSYMAFIMLM